MPKTMTEATHEAAHAVIATLVGSPVAYVSIADGRKHMRYMKASAAPPERPPTPDNVSLEMAVSLSGPIAEMLADDFGSAAGLYLDDDDFKDRGGETDL